MTDKFINIVALMMKKDGKVQFHPEYVKILPEEIRSRLVNSRNTLEVNNKCEAFNLLNDDDIFTIIYNINAVSGRKKPVETTIQYLDENDVLDFIKTQKAYVIEQARSIQFEDDSYEDKEIKLDLSELEDLGDGYYVIDQEKTIVVHKDVILRVEVARQSLMDIYNGTQPLNCRFFGDPGVGKTETVKGFAKFYNMRFLGQNCAKFFYPEDVFGGTKVNNGNTAEVLSQFGNALISDEPMLVLLDEFNRMSAECGNLFLPILDGSRTFQFDNQTYDISPNVMFIGTENRGRGLVGTFTTDKALDSRMNLPVHIQDLPNDKLAIVASRRFGINFEHTYDMVDIIRRMDIIKHNGKQLKITGRDVLGTIQMHKYGMALKEAVTVLYETKTEQNLKTPDFMNYLQVNFKS